MAAIIYLAAYMFRTRFWFVDHPQPFVEYLFHFAEKHHIRFDIGRTATEINAEYLSRRNEFWTSYVQVLVATLIIVVLTILLLTKSISAGAGLPILSAISGFAIAKGISVGKTGGGPDLPQG